MRVQLTFAEITNAVADYLHKQYGQIVTSVEVKSGRRGTEFFAEVLSHEEKAKLVAQMKREKGLK